MASPAEELIQRFEQLTEPEKREVSTAILHHFADPSELKYPSVELAYRIAIASYDVIQKRVESVETGIQALLTYAITVSLAVSAASATRGLRFNSGWFFLAACAFILAIAVGVFARRKRGLIHLSPKFIRENFLHLSEWQFKLQLISSASAHFENNLKLVNSKLRLSDVAALLFTLEALLLVIWLSVAARG